MASFLQPELSQAFDIIVLEFQNLKDKSLTQRLIDRNRKQELERDPAACRVEISQPKAPFTMSDEEVSEKFQGTRRSLAQWVEGLPEFPRCAWKRQAVGDFMQNESYTRYPYPGVGYDEKKLECKQDSPPRNIIHRRKTSSISYPRFNGKLFHISADADNYTVMEPDTQPLSTTQRPPRTLGPRMQRLHQ